MKRLQSSHVVPHPPSPIALRHVKQRRSPKNVRDAIDELYADAIDLWERACKEVQIVNDDGSTRPYIPTRYKQAIDRGYQQGLLIPAIARLVRARTEGFGRLETARRPDLMLETLVLDASKPYHHLFRDETRDVCRQRLAEYEREFGDKP